MPRSIKSQIPTGYLYEAAPLLFDWHYYNGTLSNTCLTDRAMLGYPRLLGRAAHLGGPADTLPDRVGPLRARGAAG